MIGVFHFSWRFSSDETKVSYFNWRNGEPNNGGGNEDCVVIYRSDGKMNDGPCTHKTSFVCEKGKGM